MRLYLSLFAAVGFLTLTDARWGFGGCPTVTSVAYSNAMGTAHGHKMINMDSTVTWAVGLV